MSIQKIVDVFKKESFMEKDQLQRLAQHRYKADDQSFLTEYVFRYFWDWFTKLYPLWLAPNVITFVGMIINTLATLILIWYSPDGAQSAPKWVYLLCALALFTYQTLDSTDGKQARRTNTSSPLGELFDHGCDAITQIFLALQVSLSLSLGDTQWGVVYFWLGAMYMFYAAHWQTYSTGVLKFGKFDIIESQCVIITILITTGIFGPEMWFVTIFGITLRRYLLTVVAFIALFVSSVVLFTIYTQGAGQGGRTVANTRVSMAIVPIASFLIPSTMIYWKSTSGIYHDNVCVYCIAFGLIAVKVISKVILCHMSRSPLTLPDTIMIGPLFVGINQYFGNVLSEYYVLWACLCYTALNVTFYGYAICRQICDYMKIDCFHIPYPPNKKDESVKNGAAVNGAHH